MEKGLWIAGIKITDENCNNISNFSGVSGKVSYNPSTKTLTLDNATITVTGEDYAISSTIDGLTIRVIGTCTLTTSGFAPLGTGYSRTTITGGKLKLSGSDFGLYAWYEASVIINNCDIECNNAFGTNNSNAEITINNSNITVTSMKYETMRGIQKLTLNGCAITYPSGAYYSPELRAVTCDGNNRLYGKIVITVNGSGYTGEAGNTGETGLYSPKTRRHQ